MNIIFSEAVIVSLKFLFFKNQSEKVCLEIFALNSYKMNNHALKYAVSK